MNSFLLGCLVALLFNFPARAVYFGTNIPGNIPQASVFATNIPGNIPLFSGYQYSNVVAGFSILRTATNYWLNTGALVSVELTNGGAWRIGGSWIVSNVAVSGGVSLVITCSQYLGFTTANHDLHGNKLLGQHNLTNRNFVTVSCAGGQFDATLPGTYNPECETLTGDVFTCSCSGGFTNFDLNFDGDNEPYYNGWRVIERAAFLSFYGGIGFHPTTGSYFSAPSAEITPGANYAEFDLSSGGYVLVCDIGQFDCHNKNFNMLDPGDGGGIIFTRPTYFTNWAVNGMQLISCPALAGMAYTNGVAIANPQLNFVALRTNAWTASELSPGNGFGLWHSNRTDLYFNRNSAGTIQTYKIGSIP
jgi:hypothetical protein